MSPLGIREEPDSFHLVGASPTTAWTRISEWEHYQLAAKCKTWEDKPLWGRGEREVKGPRRAPSTEGSQRQLAGRVGRVVS